MCLGLLLPAIKTDLVTEVLTLQETRRTPLEIPQYFHVERKFCLLDHCLGWVPPAAGPETIIQMQADDPKTHLLGAWGRASTGCVHSQVDTDEGDWGQSLGRFRGQCRAYLRDVPSRAWKLIYFFSIPMCHC